MQRELYKLVLVFIMILLAFSLAFFLGREMAFLDKKGEPKSGISQDPPSSQAPLKAVAGKPSPPPPPLPTHRQTVKDYQKILKKEPAPVALGKGSSQGEEGNTVSVKSIPPVYALLVKGYKTIDEAMKESTRLKVKFPSFGIFFHLSEGYYKVYIGPFKEEKLALTFLSEVQKKEEKEFKSLKLEEVSISEK